MAEVDTQRWFKWIVVAVILFGLVGCKEVSATAADNIGQILLNIQKTLPFVWKMLIALSYVMGITFTLIGLFRLKKYGQQTVMMMAAANIGEPMIFLFVGISLVYMPSLFKSMTQTFWGANVTGILSYQTDASTSTQRSEAVGPVLQIVRVIGLVAFIRGFALLTRLAGQAQPGVLGKAVIHIVGGTLAVNIYATIDIINQTLFG